MTGMHDATSYVYVPLFGFLVGALVASTGVGGGVLLLPLQIMILRIPPIMAVGSSMIFMFLTKLWASVLHWRQKNMDWRLGISLLCGSLPGALAGIGLLAYLHHRWGEGVNHLLRSLIGVLLVVLPLFVLVTDRARAHLGSIPRFSSSLSVERSSKIVLIGLFGGFLVGLTSVGEGSVIILLLFLFLRRPPRTFIATDIFHGMILSGVLSALHLRMGTADLRLVMLLMLGSLFGVMVGSKLTNVVPPLWLRRTILVLLIPMGIKML